MIYFDLDELEPQRIYKLLTSVVAPRPIAWTVTRSSTGRLNAAPYSFFNYFSGTPPVVAIGIGDRGGSPKDTLSNIRENGELVINIVTSDLIQAMNITAIPFDSEVDELAIAELKTVPCKKVNLPRIEESPVALECRLWQILDLDATTHLVLARVVGVHVTDKAVSDMSKCYIDGSKLAPIGRLQGPGWYTRTDDRFFLRQISIDQWNSRDDAINKMANALGTRL